MEEGEPGAAEEVVATEAAVEVVEEVPDKADPDKAEALKPVVVATGTVVLAILMGLQIRPVTSIGSMARGRGIVPIDTPVPGETTRVLSQNTIETLQPLKQNTRHSTEIMTSLTLL